MAFARARRWSGLIALGLLAACQTVVPRGAERPVTPPPHIVAPPANVVAADHERHRIALLLPVSGPNADIGQSLANATQMALLDTRADSVRITTYDTAHGAEAAAKAAIADGNQLILGPLLRDNVAAVARITRPAGIPVISFSNDAAVAGPNVFVMGPMPGQSVTRIVDYARAQGMTRFAGLVPEGGYGQRVVTALRRAVADSGGTLVDIVRYGHSNASLTAAATALAAKSYDAVLIGEGDGAARVAAGLLRRGHSATAKLLGTELWNTEASLNAAPALRGAWFATIPDATYRQFAAKYRARFGHAPFRLSSIGYDSVLLVVRIAQNWRVGTPFPVRRLLDRQGFYGVDGAFRFRADGLTDRMLEVQELQLGSVSVIDPAPHGFGN